MANIKENKKNGKTISYVFTVSLGRDEDGKQVRKYKTWKAPDGVPPSRDKRMAEREAEKWEKSLKENSVPAPVKESPIQKKEEASTNFNSFIDEVWLPIQVRGNNRKPKTIAFYESSTKLVKGFFEGKTLEQIRPVDIETDLCSPSNNFDLYGSGITM